MNQEIKRIKILNTEYDSQNNIVAWEIEFLEDKKKLTLLWSGNDLGNALGIKQKIPPELMKDFCDKMKGKEINLAIVPDMEKSPDFRKMSSSEIEELSQRLNMDFLKCIPYIYNKDK
jgi:hypothetical protein